MLLTVRLPRHVRMPWPTTLSGPAAPSALGSGLCTEPYRQPTSASKGSSSTRVSAITTISSALKLNHARRLTPRPALAPTRRTSSQVLTPGSYST
ncbi:hypothetical protein BD311DRAFT_479382 [Dichomitus squalens]|uniref:Uncharacterized protein n=1 Tax=Dichomitus squalens TaxID=114155 RepID=A0A4V2K1K4_9APHY|nr:hypothetical protein BD311DRAFT_479382 [Dichomitus squalens]